MPALLPPTAAPAAPVLKKADDGVVMSKPAGTAADVAPTAAKPAASSAAPAAAGSAQAGSKPPIAGGTTVEDQKVKDEVRKLFEKKQ